MDLLTKKKPINFTEDDVIDTETLVRFINKDKKKGQKKEIVRDRAIREIKRELKRIEKGK
jgi:hypothetical protein